MSRPPWTASGLASKRPFDPASAFARIRAAIREYPPAALFALAAQGYRSPFEQIVACIISVRTFDELTVQVAPRLFVRARTPEDMLRLGEAGIDVLIAPSTFHEVKARTIREIARRVVTEHGGEVPCDGDVLTSFHGVGPKCANLVLGIACGQPRVAVDVHVHRVTNRWGLVQTRTPGETVAALEACLPRERWIEINELLVPFGKHVCTGRLPRCSTCPVLDMCQQRDVTSHR